jgi:hypothetical protein
MNDISPLDYADVFRRLEQDHIRYVVVSGVAVVLHGHNRPVADLDIVIDLTGTEADRALRTLLLAGFVPSLPLPLSALTVLRMFDQSGREIDVFTRFLIPFADLWQDSVPKNVGDSVARVMSLPHLLVRNRHRARPQDILDTEGLLAIAENQTPNPPPTNLNS